MTLGEHAPGCARAGHIASAGAELDLDAGLQYDVPYRLRLGLAFPLVNRSLRSVSGTSVYFQLGYQF